jgi:hypothetical protein
MYKWIKKIKGGRAFATRFFVKALPSYQKELKQMAQSLAQNFFLNEHINKLGDK